MSDNKVAIPSASSLFSEWSNVTTGLWLPLAKVKIANEACMDLLLEFPPEEYHKIQCFLRVCENHLKKWNDLTSFQMMQDNGRTSPGSIFCSTNRCIKLIFHDILLVRRWQDAQLKQDHSPLLDTTPSSPVDKLHTTIDVIGKADTNGESQCNRRGTLCNWWCLNYSFQTIDDLIACIRWYSKEHAYMLTVLVSWGMEHRNGMCYY